MTDTDADEAFVRHKSRFALSWAMANLQRLSGSPSATSAGTPLAGRTTIVVGASYSLVNNVDLLKDAQDAGCAILAVNSSDPILRHHGVVPDAVIIRESLKHDADILESKAPLIVADIGVHPDTWTAAGDRLMWFVPGYPHLFRYSELVGVRPVFGGTSAFTTAVHLARTWGSTRIVLVGADLAMVQDDDGKWRGYHPKAPRGDQLGTIDPATPDIVEFAGNVNNDALHIASGQPPPPKRDGVVYVVSYDNGTTLPIICTLLDQKGWLETEASRHGKTVEYINCTEGGAGIVGWRSWELDDIVREEIHYPYGKPIQIPAVYPVTKRTQQQLTEILKAEAELQLNTSEQLLRKGGPNLEIMRHSDGIHLGSPLSEALSAWRQLDAPKGDVRREIEYVYTGMAEGARDALGIVRGR